MLHFTTRDEFKKAAPELDHDLPVWRGAAGDFMVGHRESFDVEELEDECEYYEDGTVGEWLESI